uniref:Uncharacterized protein n=1 Tax=Oryza glumipatula TaxID=40148 RepID=A0A0D9Y4Y6_9ORYZ
MEEKTLPPVPTPCRKVSSSRQFAIATHPISPPEPHLSRPSKAPPRIAYGDRCPRPVHQGELVRRLNEEEALTILRPSMGHPAVPRILGDARCLYGSQVANHTMFDYDNLKISYKWLSRNFSVSSNDSKRSIGLKATSLKRTEESNESQLSKLVFAIFVLLTPYLDNYQDNGEHDKERSNSYKHRNQRLAGSVGRPDKAAIRMLKNQVQMVDRFAECPGLSKQQVWRVRPAVVRKKMRRKLTGAMAMPALGSTDT